MDVSTKKKIFVGFFILLGLILFVVGIYFIGSKQNLFTSTFHIQSEFEDVNGLQEGNAVTLNGITIGTVDKIQIIAVNRVKVIMTIQSDVRQFIKKDSKITVISEGLVGNKIASILPGSVNSPAVQDDEVISSVKPVGMEDIFKNLQETSEYSATLTKDLSELISKINQGQGTIGQLLTNDQLYRSIDSTMRGFAGYTGQVNAVFHKINATIDAVSSDIGQLTKSVNKVTGDISDITEKMNSSQSIVGTLLTDTTFAYNLKEVISNSNKTTQNLEMGARGFYENMEALKHNFLFKGYFEDLGYWGVDDIEKKIDEKKTELDEIQKKLNELKKQMNELDNNKDRNLEN